ncbi:hypothetical protein E3T43_07490 [Cryobacterium sp. Hh7]|uniref:hypothetical protein n=1 Tax=Cryobacterium sp. Hh7 TaxID=1259159 RepID=UPI0010699B47|nr:hypothetical protein [Cryobacterium sp. Hh7]TFD58081.1 hypothetical protein E3T43_07490 [Cryobacterium sp. Hh7]
MSDHKNVALDRLDTGLHIHSHELKMEHFAVSQIEATLAVLAAVEAQTEQSENIFAMIQDQYGNIRTAVSS